MLNIPLECVADVISGLSVCDMPSTCDSIDYLDNHLSDLTVYYSELFGSAATRNGIIRKIIDDFTQKTDF